jgi:hypothetical protein
LAHLGANGGLHPLAIHAGNRHGSHSVSSKPKESTMKTILLAACAAIAFAAPASAQSPRLYAADGTFLGNVNNNQFGPNSISNPFGQYGSQFSPSSITNQFGKYGNPFSPNSVRNPFGR